MNRLKRVSAPPISGRNDVVYDHGVEYPAIG
jgi:hypothetical protein